MTAAHEHDWRVERTCQVTWLVPCAGCAQMRPLCAECGADVVDERGVSCVGCAKPVDLVLRSLRGALGLLEQVLKRNQGDDDSAWFCEAHDARVRLEAAVRERESV